MATNTPTTIPGTNVPLPQGSQTLLGNMLSSYASSLGINDQFVMAANVQFFQIVALICARSSGDIFQILKDYNLSRATGPALDNLGQEYGVSRLTATIATGYVTVTDSTFTQISTVIYAGTPPVLPGAIAVYASDASQFPSTGSIILGRGTVDVEAALPYSSVVQVGSYWQFNLSSPTQKYHNVNESIILSQKGVRTVPANTVVIAPGIGGSANISFTVSQEAFILDGATTVANVPVVAQLPGASGNVTAGQISLFSGAPFTGAVVTNPLAFITGQDLETDDAYRIRIQNHNASTGLGTVTAIESALQGVQDPSSSNTIVSTDVLNSPTQTVVYIDNGMGYEATHQGVGIEQIVTSALGGEQYFQLVTGGQQTSVTKALLQTINSSPFNLSGGEVLEVVVGNITYQHTFQATDFANPGSATAYEVAASINGDTSQGYESVTAGGGTYVVIRPISNSVDLIQVQPPSDTQAVNANNFLLFPSVLAETLRLYQNGKLLTEDGSTASIFTNPQSEWSSALANGETISIAVDGTEPITYTLTNADFVAEGTYQTLAASNSLQSWANVFDNVITGITATVVGSTIELTSNLGAIDRAQVTIVNTSFAPTSSGTLTKVSGTGDATITYSSFTSPANGQYIFTVTSANATAGAVYTNNSFSFTVNVTITSNVLLAATGPINYPTSLISKGVINNNDLTSTGIASQYTLNRNTAQIELVTPLVKGDTLSAGTQITRASIESSTESSGSITLAADAHIWILIDSTNTIIPTLPSGATISVSVSGDFVTYTSSSPTSFINTIPGDYVIIWSPQLPTTDQLEGRVYSSTADSLTIKVTAAEAAAATPVSNVLYVTGFCVVRTVNVPQKFLVSAGTSTLNVIAAQLQSQTDSLTFSVLNNTSIVVTTNTNDSTGEITIVTSDVGGQLIGFVAGTTNTSQSALIAFYDTTTTTSDLPLFLHSTVSADSYAEPPYTFLTTFDSTQPLSQFDPNEMIKFLDPYGGIDDEQPQNESVQMSTLSGGGDEVVTILPEYPDVRRLRDLDRFYVANPLDFGYNDTVVVVLDNNSAGETYTMPLYRVATTNTTYPSNNYSFNAYDTAAGATASFTQYFNGFDFSNFKALLQAKRVIQQSAAQTALLFRSTLYGRSGEQINISYVYPSSANQAVSSVVTVNDSVNIAISLASGTPVATSIDATTQWNVSIASNTPTAGIDQVTYTWAGQYTFNLPGVANQYIFTVSSANATAGAVYSNNGFMYTVSTTIAAGTTLTTIGTGVPMASGTLTLVSGTGDSTITFSAFAYGGHNATAGATYTNNGQTFTVVTTIVDGITLTAFGSSGDTPLASGTLTKSSGTGDSTIPYSSYTFAGAGTNPGLSSLSGGEYVNISSGTGFNIADTGTFRVSTAAGYTPTPTSFSVQVPTGTAVAQSNVVTTIANGIQFYNSTPTTAAQINTYVNANLEEYITSTIVNDGGSSGSGVIALSTYEYTGFTIHSYYLLDGINWILSSNVSGSPQFTFKLPLTYDTDTGYAFNNGDKVILVPTTMDQVQRFWSILAVTGFTTAGTIETVDRGTKLQLATMTLGSVGAVQIVGGSGNTYSVPILTAGELIDTTHMLVSANSVASSPVASDQWFRLQALNAQNKNTGISSNTSVTVLNNTPVAGQSTITLLNQEATQRYFGKPRNNIRIEGDTFRVERQGKLACLSWNTQGSSPDFSAPVNLNDSGGWTANMSATGVITVAFGATNFSGLSIGDIITISGFVNPANNGVFIVEGVALNGSSISVDNEKAVPESGTAITAGEFHATTGVSEGDTLYIPGPSQNNLSPYYSGIFSTGFSPLNQGKYRVIRMTNNSVWYENPNVIEQEVTCGANPISTGYDSTTVFNVSTAEGSQYLSWTGTGTAPALGNAYPGDIVTFGSGFASANQGEFMVTDAGAAQEQSVQLFLPAGSTFPSSGPGAYFELYNGGNANKYYVWYNVSGGSNTDPAPGGGFTGIEVTINNSDSNATVATETNTAFSALVAMTHSVLGNVVTVTATVSAVTNPPVDVSMPAAFSFIVTQTGQTPYLNVINPSAVTQSGISSVTFSINRPQMQFFEYDATVPGDVLAVNGTVLGAGNAGSYTVLSVLNRDIAIVIGNISTQYDTNIAGNQASLNVMEGVPYTGYKQVSFVTAQPGSTTFNNIIFNTIAQYDKIGPSASVSMVSQNKLTFPTTIKNGLDAYNYDTGLIGQANRVIYGDPRDSITYPGVEAAGTNIFIREPLLLRITIALSIRTNIGVSFSQISQQIQSSVYSLVQSNPLGQDLDLSSIVETVRSIPGVVSVVLTSPPYSITNDEIQLVTGQKAFLASPTDVYVSLLS